MNAAMHHFKPAFKHYLLKLNPSYLNGKNGGFEPETRGR